MTKKTLLLSVSAVSSLLLAACLDGGGGGGGSFHLSAGSYVIADASVDDGCGIFGGLTPADLNGGTLTVSTNATAVVLDFGNGPLELPRNGNSFTATDSGDDVEVATNCTVDFTDEIEGTITANDAFALTETIQLTNATGAGCSGTVTTPCTSSVGFDANLQ